MDKIEIERTLHRLILERLFRARSKHSEAEEVNRSRSALERLGLLEVSRKYNGEDTYRLTPLGLEMNGELMMVFLGVMEEAIMPIVLEEHGLIDEKTVELLYSPPDTNIDHEQMMHAAIVKAYLAKFGSTTSLH